MKTEEMGCVAYQYGVVIAYIQEVPGETDES